MDPETHRLKKTPNPAETALSDLEAQVSRVYLRLQRFRERYEAQMTPEERIWLRQTCSEVERYLIKLAHSGRTRAADERANRHRKNNRSNPLARPAADAGPETGCGST